MRPLIRSIIKTKTPRPRPVDFLYRPTDFPSIEEFVTPHIDDLKRERDIKGRTTADLQTIDAVRKILRNNNQSGDLEFFKKTILTQPTHSTNETGSIKVKISDIRDFPRPFRDYESKRNQDSMVCVGGPAAEDQVVMASIIPQLREKLNDIVYLTRDYKESNVNHSAKQSHARHGNALNADEELTGHALLPTIIMRQLLGVDVEDTLDSDYRKVDVKFTIDPKKLRIYFGNELN
ncbi:MAG: hypothetical protein FJ368_06435, partial [Pelagibacterales bacterium]|nr:hypothetical protein [Pelagibacterales bacterium]